MLTSVAKLGNLEERLHVTNCGQHGLHSAIRKALLAGRILGLLPLSGLGNPNSRQLRFSLLSPYALIYFSSLGGQVLMCSTSIYWLAQNKVTLTNVTNSLFYSLSLISILILTNIGQTWPKLIAKVEDIEKTLPPFKRNIPFFCNVTVVIILLLGLIEHILSIIYGYTVAKSCHSNNVFETFFHYDKPWIFHYTPYSLWKGILVEIFNWQATFAWTYNDILIMIISIYLAEHFVVHNQHLEEASKQIIRLVKLINKQVGIFILTCLCSNLYWICTQLFYSLKAVHGIEHTIYFTFSFLFLMARTLLVLMLAARVHSTSIVPVSLLYEVPTTKFNLEMERYISQINNIKVALTGLDFFYVTRTMILTLLRTIVTYELVLLQFNK